MKSTTKTFRFEQLSNLEIHLTPDKGYGVFTKEDINSGEIGSNPALFIPSDSDVLNSYVFESDENHVLAMGFFSYLNHSNNANCAYWIDTIDGRPVVYLEALRHIKVGEELTINYHGVPDDPTPWEF